ncbi:LysR substrate-binding domain-containing protein [Marinomonas arenicola]|uniref:LysR substrate-binding domain-containing protein n=1 Tax=Marinomonas arenicola TaxID=569601 RepID=A0ABU9G104_9GAMM
MQATRLPPLGALQAFEAAAESGSFAKAAEKLFVTPAAISQKIRGLEEQLDTVLFERSKQGVSLTRVGQSYLIFIQEGLEKIRLGQQQIKQFSNLEVITITTFPSIAAKWLMPQVLSWMDSHPTIEIRVEASHSKVDFSRSASDICLCFGNQDYPALNNDRLFNDTVSLVASPRLLTTLTDTNNLDAIFQLPMIHIDWGSHNQNLPNWEDWLKAAGLSIKTTRGGPHFNLSSMAIEAAVQGKGLLLGQDVLINDELKSGRLVKLSEVSLPLGQAYYLAYPERTLDNPNAALFIEWIKQKAKELTP